MRIFVLILACISMVSVVGQSNTSFVDDALEYCVKQTRRTLHELKVDSAIDYNRMPRNILSGELHWNCRKASKEEWTTGFWPGVLWYAFEHTQDEYIKKEAEKFTSSLKFLSEIPAYDHDLGFLVFNSYGNAYRLTGNPAYKQILLQTADTLATLFNPVVGTILSWPREVQSKGWPHNTIIDNMMNLELLFWAARNGGNKNLYDMAVAHANTTMKNHFKSDFSCYHVLVYDTITGKKIKGVTHQGYSDASMWARGQGWAIYGFTMCYRETGNTQYLQFAQKVADAYLIHLPKDAIPYWDFNDPQIPHAPKDASAAAVVASGLIELSTFVQGTKARIYLLAALRMLYSLSSTAYQCREKAPAFIGHSTGHFPNHSEIDASIIYADYYYIEALLRYRKCISTLPN